MYPAMPDAVATLPRLSLPIEGMTCAACAGRVERALRKVPGVVEVQVNPATDRAEIQGSGAGAAQHFRAIRGGVHLHLRHARHFAQSAFDPPSAGSTGHAFNRQG